MKRQPTIRDVARQAGVSIAVVSRVLNDGTGPVAPATRERVLAVIEALGYRPRTAARELSQGHASTIGLLLADLTNPFFARLADRIVWEARARSVQVLLMTTQEDQHLEAESLETMLGRSVAGVIATPTGENIEAWQRLSRAGVEVVFVDRTIDRLPEFDVVSIGNESSARAATDHLLDLGHERIGFISGPVTTSTGREREAGYRSALAARGVPYDPALLQAVPFRGEAGGDAVGRLLAAPEPPTALIVGNTAQARNALRRIIQTRVAVPDELSVIVFDDNPWSELITPPLTVVGQPIDMLATHSTQLLLDRIHGRIPEGPRRIEVEAEFVARASCAAPRLAAARR